MIDSWNNIKQLISFDFGMSYFWTYPTFWGEATVWLSMLLFVWLCIIWTMQTMHSYAKWINLKPPQTPLASLALQARTTMVDFQSQSSFAPWPGVAVCCRLAKDRKLILESNRVIIYLVEYLKSCGFALHSHCIEHMRIQEFREILKTGLRERFICSI